MNLGKKGEDKVAAYYQKLGYQILDRNFIFPFGKQMGELDLVVQKKNEVVFVEVKTRSNSKFGDAFESVNIYKQQKLIKMAKLYMNHHPQLGGCEFRIDVAAVDVNNPDDPIAIINNAIEDCY